MRVIQATLFALAAWLPVQASATLLPPDVRIGIGEGSGIYCSGGLEGRKLIELVDGISDAFKQTTQTDCESTGGTPLLMPDLPQPTTEREVLV